MLSFANIGLDFDIDFEVESDVTFAQANRAIADFDRLEVALEREVGLFDRLAGPVTVTYARA